MECPHKYTNEEISNAAHNVRKQVLRLVIDHGGGYLGQTCSSAEVITTMYMRVLHLGESLGSMEAEPFRGAPGPDNMDAKRGGLHHGPATGEYDRFYISPPHYAAGVYSALVECGRLSREAIKHYNKDGWQLEMLGGEHSPGFENMGGSLGQTISIAAGAAHARKLKGDSGKVYCYITDGESEEGQVWEAIQSAAAMKLDNFVVYFDANGQQCEGATKDILSLCADNFVDRFKAFGAETVVIDGHDIDAITAAAATPHPGKPLVVVCVTSCTRDMQILERRRPNLHHIAFGKDELAEVEAFYAAM